MPRELRKPELSADLLYDVVSAHAKKPVESRGRFPSVLEELALSQTTALAVKDVYASIAPVSPGIRKRDIDGRTIEEAAENLATRLEKAKSVLDRFARESWVLDFTRQVSERKATIDVEWRTNWKDLCSGKVLVEDLYRRYELSLKPVEFKKILIKRMAETKTDDWRVLNDLIASGIR